MLELFCFFQKSGFQRYIDYVGNKCVPFQVPNVYCQLRLNFHALGCCIDQEIAVFQCITKHGSVNFKDTGTKLFLEAKSSLARAVDNSNLFRAFIEKRANDRLCSSSRPNDYCSLISQIKSGVRMVE